MMKNPSLRSAQHVFGSEVLRLGLFAGALAIVCLMMGGCEESGNTLDAPGPASLGKAALSKVAPMDPTVVLMPTGDATQDTENLQAAILDPSMNSGGLLYLGPGTFYVHSSLVRQSFDPGEIGYSPELFNGTIQGAGKGVTTVKSVRGPEDAPFETFMDLPGTFMIWDFDYCGVRDLTFEADSEIADYWEFPGLPPSTGLLSFVNLGSGMYGVGGQYGTDCVNVHFKGSLDSEGNPEIPVMWECYGGGGGIHNIRSCDFENGSLVMLDYGEWSGGTINIGGSPRDKVTFTNNTGIPVYSVNAFFVGDCDVNVSYIETHNAGGFGFWTHGLNNMSRVTVTNNTINMIPDSWSAGVEIYVEPGSGEVSATVSGNRIHSDDSFPFGPILTEGVQDGLIANNIITGRGPAAIYLGVLEQWPGSVRLLGNNVQKWENTGTNPWGFAAAAIWLGSYTTNSIVVGGNNKVNVFDEPGYDWDGNPLPPDINGNAQTYEDPLIRENIVPKNNFFTGVNNMYGNVGEEVRNAMLRKVDARKAMMNRLMH